MSYTVEIKNDATGQTVKSYTVSDASMYALLDSLNGPQMVLAWITGAIMGKIKNCKKRMIERWIPIFRSDGQTMPINDDDFILEIIARPDYLDREARDSEG